MVCHLCRASCCSHLRQMLIVKFALSLRLGKLEMMARAMAWFVSTVSSTHLLPVWFTCRVALPELS